MSQGGEPRGVLAVFARAAREPEEAEIKLAQVAAQLAAIAIERNDAKVAG
jgi:GAF domain-containing protein